MEKLSSLISYIVPFVTGGAIMAIEMLGARILAPVLGTTIAVWSAIIAVILAGISCGYFLGGTLAEKKQSNKPLSILLFMSALALAPIIFLRPYLPQIMPQLPYGLLALGYTLLFFFLPAFFLGASTTYLISIRATNLDRVGKVNGSLYGISTVGSLVGIYLTSFYLVPNFAVSNILYGIAGILIGMAVFSLFFKGAKFKLSLNGEAQK